MNKLQQELYDRVKSRGPGQRYVVEVIHEYPRLGVSRRAKTKTTGRQQFNTMLSMLPPKGWAKHLPGGYRREIKFELVEEHKIDRIFHNKDFAIAQLVVEHYVIVMA